MTKYEDLPRDDAGDIKAMEVAFPVEFGLATPIDLPQRKLSRLTIREPLVGDIEVASAESTGLKRMIRMITLVAEISDDEAKKMGSRDYVELQGFLENFL